MFLYWPNDICYLSQKPMCIYIFSNIIFYICFLQEHVYIFCFVTQTLADKQTRARRLTSILDGKCVIFPQRCILGFVQVCLYNCVFMWSNWHRCNVYYPVKHSLLYLFKHSTEWHDYFLSYFINLCLFIPQNNSLVKTQRIQKNCWRNWNCFHAPGKKLRMLPYNPLLHTWCNVWWP